MCRSGSTAGAAAAARAAPRLSRLRAAAPHGCAARAGAPAGPATLPSRPSSPCAGQRRHRRPEGGLRLRPAGEGGEWAGLSWRPRLAPLSAHTRSLSPCGAVGPSALCPPARREPPPRRRPAAQAPVALPSHIPAAPLPSLCSRPAPPQVPVSSVFNQNEMIDAIAITKGKVRSQMASARGSLTMPAMCAASRQPGSSRGACSVRGHARCAGDGCAALPSRLPSLTGCSPSCYSPLPPRRAGH